MSDLRASIRVGAWAGITAALLLVPPPLAGQQRTIDDATRGLDKRDGYFPLYWDPARGRLLLEVPRPGEEFLYLNSLATGVGANGLGLDRGMIGPAYIGRFDRVGARIFFTLENPRFRAEVNPDPALVRSVEESFPTSVVGAFEIMAEQDGRLLVDATSFFLRDAMNVAQRLQGRGQGNYRLDRDRSAVYLDRTRAFPENTEVEASLTFVSESPGGDVSRHTPDGRALTVRQHHSLVKLPDDGYTPRNFDPRVGVFSVSFYDYGKGFDEDPVTRYASRHRLIKRDPAAPMSEPVEPIVYYLDPAVPEPYRQAFKDGGAWWNQVFEAAGFVDAFRIEDMPPGMDPMDARYNVIQWVHRTEAGSSIGPSYRDPRTGEIIKAAVRMDSHRSLVDYNLYAGALGTAVGADDDGLEAFLGAGGGLDWITELDQTADAEAFAMARRRQHSAHEIGHTLGLAHNFIAVSYGRASVMDYPAPLIRLVDGRIDVSEAYRSGPGAYDTLAIRYAYTEFPPGEEGAGLAAIVAEGMEKGIEFITNSDEAGSGSHPDATTWINGEDVLDELDRVTPVRHALIEQFGEAAIRPGEPLWRLNERFVPVYLHHRFTLGAAIKTIGGMEFRYALRGDPVPPTAIIPAARQQRALNQLMAALRPSELAVPERILRVLAPRPYGYAADRRAFDSDAAPAFDQIGIARTLATSIVGGILDPRRAARVVAFHDRDPGLPSLEDIVGRLVDDTWGRATPREQATLHRMVQRVVLDELMNLAADGRANVESRAAAEWGLRRIVTAIQSTRAVSPTETAHRDLATADIDRFLSRRYEGGRRAEPLPPPPGTPIGSRGH